MIQVHYKGSDESLKGQSALGRFAPTKEQLKFLVQVDDRNHPWTFGWHETPFEDWQVDPILVARAKRCQLLVGSYKDALRSCPCSESSKCCLTDLEQEALSTFPEVREARRRNKQEFKESLNEDLDDQ